MDVISSEFIKAKKEHKCNFCYGIIEKGELYNRQAIKNDGFYVWKSHKSCVDLIDKMGWIDYGHDGLTSDDFQEGIKIAFYDLNGKQDHGVPFTDQLKFLKDKYLNVNP